MSIHPLWLNSVHPLLHSLSQVIGQLRGRSSNCFSGCWSLLLPLETLVSSKVFPWGRISEILTHPFKSRFCWFSRRLQSWSSKNMYAKVINPLCLHIITHTPTHPRPRLCPSESKGTSHSYAVNWGWELQERGGEDAGGRTLFHFSRNLYLHQNLFRIYDIVFRVCVQ